MELALPVCPVRPVLRLLAALVLGTATLAARGTAVAPAWAAEPKPSEAAPAKAAGDRAEDVGALRHLAPAEAASVLGRPLQGADGHDIGRIVDVLVDQAGHPRAAVIDFGGFLGVGSRKIAVDWHLLHFAPGDSGKPITLALTPDQIKAAPEYKSGSTPTIVTAPPAATPIPTAPPVAPAAPTEARTRAPAASASDSAPQLNGNQARSGAAGGGSPGAAENR